MARLRPEQVGNRDTSRKLGNDPYESSGRLSSSVVVSEGSPPGIGSSDIGIDPGSGTFRMVAVALRGDQPTGGLKGRSGVPGR